MRFVIVLIGSIIAGITFATPPDAKYPECWPANIRDPTDSRSNEAGASVSITCQSKRGSPNPDLVWSRNGVDIVGNQEFTTNNVTKLTQNRYAWILSGIDHQATLTCTQTHPEANPKSCSVGPLRVRYGPDITLEPNTVGRVIGETAIFNCSARGNPAVTEIQWLFNDTSTLPDLQRFLLNADNQLTIHNITYSDYYLDIKCQAQSTRGIQSKTVEILPVNETTTKETSTGQKNTVASSHFVVFCNVAILFYQCIYK
ncbi:immunoglobulin superfamily DCC subclass member 3-like [Saccoglossus kowalevskii]|uniref:Cell adhesion molecule 4-like n=1 Tax=Saccoglossus kowalevskii TaxID=10224 RepID=A0ABM0MA18_SACKO|nr:PREDICTED: cell adhesion molecule 4-like [Saccoglossus kowalevskii]